MMSMNNDGFGEMTQMVVKHFSERQNELPKGSPGNAINGMQSWRRMPSTMPSKGTRAMIYMRIQQRLYELGAFTGDLLSAISGYSRVPPLKPEVNGSPVRTRGAEDHQPG